MKRFLKIISFIAAILFVVGSFLYNFVLTDEVQKADVIVVLGCAVLSDGSASPMLRSRVEKGISLWKDGVAPSLLFTGGAVTSPKPEAEVMESIALEEGVPKKAIFLEPTAHSTLENGFASAQIIKSHGWNNVILVTSTFHTYRARKAFKIVGITPLVTSAPFPEEYGWYRQAQFLKSEISKAFF